MRITSLLAAAILLVAACAPARPAPSPVSPAPPAAEEGADHEDAEDETPPSSTAKPPAHPPHATASGPCKKDLAHCTPIGCAKADSPHAIFNQLKRRTTDRAGAAITRETARSITFWELHDLQIAADAALPDSKDLTNAQREQLVALALHGGGTFGEGTGVRLVGFIAPDSGTASSGAHPGGIESVNCRLTKPEERDVHVPIISKLDLTECDGVVVEPIPQTRAEHPSWTASSLRQLAHQKKLVMFVGPLFWDNEHKVNPDCGRVKSGQPKRMSLWEIHPVTELYVCDAGTCSADDKTGWRKLD